MAGLTEGRSPMTDLAELIQADHVRISAAGARIPRISSFPGHWGTRNFVHRLSCLPRR
jgi:hypothetical protein